ncbi:MAG: dUTP diphosphatase [Candidatus Campbellbacteria bacterium]|nr:dUTP diphosphatase [Candidatus Campbellbacteria bacterium]
MDIKVKKLEKEAKLPVYANLSDAGADLFALEGLELSPGERTQVRTGIAMEIPDGYVGLIWDKSGLSHKQGLKVLGGVIDASYRGEIMVGIINLGNEKAAMESGHKVAQILFQRVEQAGIVEVNELNETSRGEGGFGSTGR